MNWQALALGVAYALFERWLGRTDKVSANSTVDLISDILFAGTEKLIQKFKGEKIMDSPSPEAKPLVDVLNLVCDGINLGLKVAADKGPSIADVAELLKMLPDVAPAIAALPSVPASLAHLSPSDAAAIEAGVVASLNIPAGQGQAVVQSILDVLVKIEALYQAIKAAPVVPVAEVAAPVVAAPTV